MTETLHIDTTEAEATIDIVCENDHEYPVDLSQVNEMLWKPTEDKEEKEYSPWSLSCPECGSHEVVGLKLGEIY